MDVKIQLRLILSNLTDYSSLVSDLFCSSAVAEYLEAHLLNGDLLGLVSGVGDHASAYSLLDGLRNVLAEHEVLEVAVQAGELVDKGEVVQGHCRDAWLAVRNVGQDLWTIAVHIENQVLQLLLVDLEMLHHHVVAQTVALVKELPIIKHVVEVLLSHAIDLDTVPNSK